MNGVAPRRKVLGRRSAALALIIGSLIVAAAVPAVASWTTSGAGSGRSAGATVNAATAPATAVSGSTVTLTWAASTLSNGAAVTGYTIKRYNAAGTVQQTVAAGTCATLVAGTDCSQTSVPTGSWTYSVTPARSNWLGAESAKAAAVVGPSVPTPTIDSGPANPTTSTSATFTFSDTQLFVTFQCQLDGGGFTACALLKTYTGLANGAHTFQVRAVDLGGNLSSPASYPWTIDTSPPAVAVTFPVSGARYNVAGFNAGCGTADVGDLCGTAADTGSGVSTLRLSLRQGSGNYWNGTAFASITEVLLTPSGTASWSYAFAAASFPANGSYTARAVGTDGAGATTNVATTFTIDTLAPPTPTGTASVTNPTAATAATFTFADAESGVVFKCQLDGSAYSPCTTPKTYTGLGTGSHTFRVLAEDAAGNQSGTAHYTWIITPTVAGPVNAGTTPLDAD